MNALSPTDSAFLWMETRNQPMHVAGLNIFTPPPGAGPHFIAELLADWGKYLVARPPFNQRPVLRMGLWYWEDDEHFELDYHLRHVALPQPGRIRELLAMVSRLHGNLMDRNRPLWEIYVIEGLPGGRFGLIAQLTSVARAGRDILPGIGSGLWDMLRSMDDGAPALPFQAPPTPFNVEISGSRRFASQSYSLARFKRIGEATGATVNDVTLAICAGALRKYLEVQKALPKKPLIAMVPVSLHGETDAGGNQVSLLLANLATHVRDPLKRLQRIVQSTQEAKDRLKTMPRLQKLAHGITSISPMGPAMVTGSARNHPLFNVIISNVPGPRHTLYCNGARLDEIYPVSIPTQYLALNITISGYCDNLGFGYTACRRSVPALQRMLDYTDQSILELEQALVPKATKVRAKAATKPTTKPATKRKVQRVT